jgi:hypothetical protein
VADTPFWGDSKPCNSCFSAQRLRTKAKTTGENSHQKNETAKMRVHFALDSTLAHFTPSSQLIRQILLPPILPNAFVSQPVFPMTHALFLSSPKLAGISFTTKENVRDDRLLSPDDGKMMGNDLPQRGVTCV